MSAARKVQLECKSVVSVSHSPGSMPPSSPDSRDAELASDLWRRSEEILELNVEGLMESDFGISGAEDTTQMAK